MIVSLGMSFFAIESGYKNQKYKVVRKDHFMKDMRNKKRTIISIHEDVKGEFELVGQILIIKLTEDLDHHNALHIREHADKLIMNRNIKHIIFDFTGTDFMDSSGIGVIMGRYKKVIFIGGSVFVTGTSKNINRIFKLSGLYKIIEKYAKIEDALDAIGKNESN